MKTPPFAYVVLIRRGRDIDAVSVHPNLDDAEDALRAYAARSFDNGDEYPDHEIVETFVEDGAQVRVFAFVMWRKIQTSFELEPFTRRQVVA
jgi:hypothetical protein